MEERGIPEEVGKAKIAESKAKWKLMEAEVRAYCKPDDLEACQEIGKSHGFNLHWKDIEKIFK